MRNTPTQATLLIVRRDKRILLGTKDKSAQIGGGLLNAPGGRVEKGESALDCVIREAAEEVGIVVDPSHVHHIGVLECYAAGELFQDVMVYYTERFEGEPHSTPSMIPEWVRAESLPFTRMHEGDRQWFHLAAAARPFHLRVWYERPGTGYLRHQFI